MKFYNRTSELEALRQTMEQSGKSSCFTVIIGRRRIGKTTLLLESYKAKKYLYLFVSRVSEPVLCAQFQKTAQEVLGMKIFGTITKFKDLFEQLMIFATTEHFTLIIINGFRNKIIPYRTEWLIALTSFASFSLPPLKTHLQTNVIFTINTSMRNLKAVAA